MPPTRVGNDVRRLSTSVSLLERLRGPDREEAWAELVARYGPPVYQWFLRWRLQPADAADLVQEVFVRLVRRMPEFRYDDRRSFRAYLKTLARYAWCDLQERSRSAGPGKAGMEELEEVTAREDLERRLEEQFDHELLNEAMALVATRVNGSTWEAFRLQAIEGLPATEVAGRLAMKIASVYKARSNILRMLREAVQELEHDAPPGSVDGTVQNRENPPDSSLEGV